MNKWEHLNFDQRKIIKSFLARNENLNVIAEVLDKDPTTISKEIKRNREKMKTMIRFNELPDCRKTERFPHVCDGCEMRLRCGNDRYTYDPKIAENKANFRLSHSRRGINLTEEEFEYLNKAIKEGTDNNYSIYHIVHDDENIPVSVPTVYKYIDANIMDTKTMDLPYKVTLKKRKKKYSQYEYKENISIDRTKRTYIDFLKFLRDNKNPFYVQMDFLGAIKNDHKKILVMTIPALHYVMLHIIDRPNQDKVENIFTKIERWIGTDNFTIVFPAILTDRDPCFNNYDKIEYSIINQVIRTHIFYCDSLASTQKANVEQMNKQLRRYFPKGTSIDHITPDVLKGIENKINHSRVASLSKQTPDEAFSAVYGEELLKKLKYFID